MTIKLSLVERIFLTLENADSSYLAYATSNFILIVIIVSSSCFVLGTLPQCHSKSGYCAALKGIESTCLVIFILEYVARVCTVWGVRTEIFDKENLIKIVTGFEPIHLQPPWYRMWTFITTPSNLIDLAAILPGVLAWAAKAQGGAFVILRLVRLTRLLRAFKSPALSEAVQLISKTLQLSTKALYILVFNLMLGIVIFGSLMYMAEGGPELNTIGLGGRWNNESKVFERVTTRTWDNESDAWLMEYEESPYQSIPHACWWALVTATTVGYGDSISSSPTTIVGKMVGIAVMLFSFVILALPVGVIGGNFGQVWDENEKRKQTRGESIQNETDFVAYEIAKLDPRTMVPLLLIEVWDDRHGMPICDGCEPPPPTFMGEGQVYLELPEGQVNSEQITVTLASNQSIAKRGVTGTITIKYDWTPSHVDPNQPTTPTKQVSRASRGITSKMWRGAGAGDLNFAGALEVTVLGADNLINLDVGNGKGTSSPFCTVLCYPSHKHKQGCPKAGVWCTPTAKRTSNPVWEARQVFDFDWQINSKSKGEVLDTTSEELQCKQCGNICMPDSKFCRNCGAQRPEGSELGGDSDAAALPINGTVNRSPRPCLSRHGSKPSLSRPGSGTSLGRKDNVQAIEVLSLVKELSMELQSQRNASWRVQEEVRALSERVDKVPRGVTNSKSYDMSDENPAAEARN